MAPLPVVIEPVPSAPAPRHTACAFRFIFIPSSVQVSSTGVQCIPALQPRPAFGDPPRGRLSLEPVTEPLEDPALIVDLVLPLPQAVVLARVDEQNEVVPAGAPCEVVELDSLMPVDGAVRVAEHHEHGRVELVDPVCR